MITYKMHFIRTGKTSPGTSRRYVGKTDLPLCGEGIEELKGLYRNYIYPRAEIVFTSPLKRCVETAGILYPDHLTEKSDGLADLGLGEFEGKSIQDLKDNADFLNWLDNSFKNAPPHGEKLGRFTQRISEAAEGIFKRMMEEKITNAAIITHGGVIMTLLAAIGAPRMPLYRWEVQNGTGYTLLFTPQMWMRDGLAEVFCRQPRPTSEDRHNSVDYGLYPIE